MLCVGAIMVFVSCAWGDTLNGRVVGVADGDTLTVLDSEKRQFKVRLAGIDAPEKAQEFGGRSKQSLSDLAFQKDVHIHFSKADRYGRIVGKVLVGSTDANLEQVRRGMAWHYKAYAAEQTAEDRGLYGDTEIAARTKRVGLWSHINPQPPWEYRTQKRRNNLQ